MPSLRSLVVVEWAPQAWVRGALQDADSPPQTCRSSTYRLWCPTYRHSTSKRLHPNYGLLGKARRPVDKNSIFFFWTGLLGVPVSALLSPRGKIATLPPIWSCTSLMLASPASPPSRSLLRGQALGTSRCCNGVNLSTVSTSLVCFESRKTHRNTMPMARLILAPIIDEQPVTKP